MRLLGYDSESVSDEQIAGLSKSDSVQNGHEGCHFMQPKWSMNREPGVGGAPVKEIQPLIPLVGHTLKKGKEW